MRLISRTPISTAPHVSDEAVADYLRLEAAEVPSASACVFASAVELERYAAIALLSQTIVAEASEAEAASLILSLPIGPLLATPTVELINADGSTTEITTSTTSVGQHPETTLAEDPGGRVRVTYTAGYGTVADDIPRDLHLAILDQALRLYDRRGDEDMTAMMAPAAARICARYRRVRMGA